ncbi:uncharacterized protein LOC129952431 [Eupeodes corollae]|uniref:uncharacterized protein LOC129952431 n=1 Tax=Eupeodes corollae TaxID=290404 RepID=UPI002490B97E|nr:uncharacterized protein LOC129952431 [Eupeodes corollae]XP_055920976.1 uncharacterized protein LOC129952431 [Eupeodes corollae]XP_055920977.1 uncharacterized protein LOC129952431 [Eupeodes corollae]XP_055920978.1 uncharacterized protein LOC129952431 [Eupeodes corollae]
MAPKFESLYYMKLPLAGLIVGFLTAIVGFLNIVELIGALIAFDDREPSFIIINSHESAEIIGWEICGYFLFMLSGFFLVLGTIKKSHRMILPWLLISGVIILFGIGYVVFSLISMIRNLESDFGKLLIFIVLGIFILPGLGIYTWIGILSLYQNLRDKNQRVLTQVDAEKLYINPGAHSNSNVGISSSPNC